jgi:peptide/nickel transport system substrate-binding protein
MKSPRPVGPLTLAAALSFVAVAPANTAYAAPSSASTVIPLFRIGLDFPEPNLDPTKNYEAHWLNELSLDGLENLGPQGQIEPNLATSVTEPNPVTYVYHLRHDVKFWDGDPLTATDVAFSLNYYRSPGSAVSFEFSPVKTITASGPYTVVVTLPQPDAAWAYTPAEGLGIFEKKFYMEHKASFGQPGTLVMGSGPWEIDSLDPTTGAELSANPDWWGGKVPVDKITYKFFSNETSLALAFRAGEVDLDPLIEDAKTFASTSGATLMNSPSCLDGIFGMNTAAAPWSDVDVRQAVAYALDRTDIIAANGGYAVPDYTLIPAPALRTIASQDQVNSLLQSVNTYQYSIANAAHELAQSAYPHGFSAPFLVWSYGNSVNVAQVIVSELSKIGINLGLKVVPLAQYSANLDGPAAQRDAYLGLNGCTNPDVSGYDFLLAAGNSTNWQPAAFGQLLSAGTATTEPSKRLAIFSKVLGDLSAAVPLVPLYLTDFSIALSNKYVAPGSFWQVDFGPFALDIRSNTTGGA